MPEPSAGGITFLFTDIEGSTRFWDEHPEAMQPALARHDALLRAAIESHGGCVFKTIGDAFCAAFAGATDALRAAIAAQRALRREVPELRVRMAVHTGEAQPRDDDYFGPALNHVARLLGAGHGGQVLLSQATAEEVSRTLPADTELRPLGRHQLRDIAAWETIFQLELPDLPARFPPLNTLNVAFRRGVVRAASIAAVVLTAMAALALMALYQRRVAEEGERKTRHLLYLSDMSLAHQDWKTGNMGRMVELLNTHRPRSGEADLRGFEWFYLNRLFRGERFTLQDPRGKLLSVAFSPDGKTVATGGEASVTLWDADTGRELGILPGPARRVYHLRFSPDSEALTTMSLDKTVQSWDLRTRRSTPAVAFENVKVRTDYPLSLFPQSAATLSPDGHTLATRDENKAVVLRDLTTGRVLRTLPTEIVTGMAFSPDSETLATAHVGVALWNVRTGRKRVLPVYGPWSPSLAYSPNGRRLAIGRQDSTIRIWDVTEGREERPLTGTGTPFTLVFSLDGRRLVSAARGSTARIWDVATRQELLALKGPGGMVISAVFSPDGKWLALVRQAGMVQVWDTAPRQEGVALRGHAHDINSVAFSPDGMTLATGSEDGTARLWDVGTRRSVRTLMGERFLVHAGAFSPARERQYNPVKTVGFSPDGKTLATASEKDKTIKLWDVSTGREKPTLVRHLGPLTTMAFGPDWTTLAAGDATGGLKVLDIATGRKRWAAKAYPRYVRSVAFSRDGKRLATGGLDGEVKVWEAASGRELLAPLKGHTSYVASVAFSPDGSRLATGSADNTVRLWDPATRQTTLTLQNESPVWAVAYSPDGKRLATGSEEGAVKLWDAVTGRELLSLQGHKRGVYSLEFSPDGRRLAMGGMDTMMILWEAVSPEEVAASDARERAGSMPLR